MMNPGFKEGNSDVSNDDGQRENKNGEAMPLRVF